MILLAVRAVVTPGSKLWDEGRQERLDGEALYDVISVDDLMPSVGPATRSSRHIGNVAWVQQIVKL